MEVPVFGIHTDADWGENCVGEDNRRHVTDIDLEIEDYIEDVAGSNVAEEQTVAVKGHARALVHFVVAWPLDTLSPIHQKSCH